MKPNVTRIRVSAHTRHKCPTIQISGSSSSLRSLSLSTVKRNKTRRKRKIYTYIQPVSPVSIVRITIFSVLNFSSVTLLWRSLWIPHFFNLRAEIEIELWINLQSEELIFFLGTEMEEEMVEEEEYCFTAYEIDIDYEFDASRFFDFTRAESLPEARTAESWFDSAPSCPPSRKLLPLLCFFYWCWDLCVSVKMWLRWFFFVFCILEVYVMPFCLYLVLEMLYLWVVLVLRIFLSLRSYELLGVVIFFVSFFTGVEFWIRYRNLFCW